MIDGTVDGGGHAAAILEGSDRAEGFWDWIWTKRCSQIAKRGSFRGKESRFSSGTMPTFRKFSSGKNLGGLMDCSLTSGFLPNSSNIKEGDSALGRVPTEPLRMTYEIRGRRFGTCSRPFPKGNYKISFLNSAESIMQDASRGRSWSDGEKGGIATSGDLADAVRAAVPKGYEHGHDPANADIPGIADRGGTVNWRICKSHRFFGKYPYLGRAGRHHQFPFPRGPDRKTIVPGNGERIDIGGRLTLHNMTAFVYDDADYAFPRSGYRWRACSAIRRWPLSAALPSLR